MKIFVVPFTFLWPGCNGLVRYGLWDQLGIALTFGALCQASCTAIFLWRDFLPRFGQIAIGGLLVVSWFFLNVVASSRLKNYEKIRSGKGTNNIFLEAQTHYLKGNWFETECCLKALLKKNPYDVEALLLLATLYRHNKRFADAKRTLTSLDNLDGSCRWRYEIALEKEAIVNEEKEARENKRSEELEIDEVSEGNNVEEELIDVATDEIAIEPEGTGRDDVDDSLASSNHTILHKYFEVHELMDDPDESETSNNRAA